MTCGCATGSEVFTTLAPYMAQLTPITWGTLNNVLVLGNELYRSGGTPDTNDAYGYSASMVEGESCALWECRQFFDDVTTNNEIYFVIEDEFGGADKYGWHFTNQTVDSRRAPRHGVTEDFPLYYGPAGGPGPPDQVGYNVGFRFGIYYNNGTVKLYENDQWTNDTNDFFGSDEFSYTYTGLATDRRWRLRVFVFPAALDGHSPEITELIVALSDVCVEADWELPALEWTAEATVTTPEPPPSINTMTFDAGDGNEWFIVPQISDGGDELRSKNLKSPHATGRLTNPRIMLYGYDIGDVIDTDDLEAGTNSSTGAITLPDSTGVAQTPRVNLNVPNAVLGTLRLSGDDTGNEVRDEIHEVVMEQSSQGVRR